MNQHQKGFTLIEMLIAMAIFTALISVLMLGFRQGLLMWEKGQQQSRVWQDDEFRYRLLDTLVSQAVVADDECAEKNFSPYFVGTKDLMKFISAAPIMNVLGRVQFVMLEAKQQADGRWNLRYHEGRSKAENGDWVLLLEGLQKLSFSFEAPIRRAPNSTDVRWWGESEKKLYRDKAEWLIDYDACTLRVYPQQLLISFIDADGGVHSWLFAPPQKPDAWSLGAYFVDG